jgi:hypothetical protein
MIGDRIVHCYSPSFETTTKGSWFQDLIFLLPFSSSGRRRGWGMRRFEYGNGMARPA